jgi:hypothetical protein
MHHLARMRQKADAAPHKATSRARPRANRNKFDQKQMLM